MVSWKVGTIGFAYEDWRGVFYPPAARTQDRLAYYASRFSSVELDTTFYAMPTAERMRKWAGAVPSDFRFALKAPRELSHDDRPGWFGRPAARNLMGQFVDLTGELDGKLGAILLQLSPQLSFSEVGALEDLLGRFSGVPVAVEFRHPSWVRPEAAEMLRRVGAVWVAADLAPVGHAARTPGECAGYHPLGWFDTGSFVYLRLCGTHAQYATDDHELHDATARIRWWLDVLSPGLVGDRVAFGFCGNSFAGHGPATCGRLQTLVGDRPLPGIQPGLFDG